MLGQEIFTALLFYLPFLLTIVFGVFALTIGILAIFSGTILILLLAVYGVYALLRDTGTIGLILSHLKSVWTFISHDIEKNLQESFILSGLETIPTKPALFLCHPHGLIGYSWMLHFCYEISQWPHEKPKPLVAIHSILFRLPIVRDILEQFRCIEAREDIITSHLKEGKSVAIVTGGIEEMVYNGDTTIKIVLQKRKGYARIAKECNVPIVPLFTVGENELFPNETFWLWKHVARLIHKWTKIYVPLPSWTSMTQWAHILRKPLETPVETFVLGVVETKQKEESQIRKECLELYRQFFQEKGIQAKIIA
jgi:hypothetical protein